MGMRMKHAGDLFNDVEMSLQIVCMHAFAMEKLPMRYGTLRAHE